MSASGILSPSSGTGGGSGGVAVADSVAWVSVTSAAAAEESCIDSGGGTGDKTAAWVLQRLTVIVSSS